MERVWMSRLRWRLRGAWQWPAFAAALVGDAVVLHELPPAGAGTGVGAALLISGFLNLAVVALAAPLAGRALRHRRPDLPRVVAGDYAGAVLLGVAAAVLLGAGLAHRPQMQAQRDEVVAGLERVRDYVREQAPARYRAHLGQATTLRFGGGLLRTCVPGGPGRRPLCLFVYLDQSPPGLRVDPSATPNSLYVTSPHEG